MNLEPFGGLAYINVNLSDFTKVRGPAALTGHGGNEGVDVNVDLTRQWGPRARNDKEEPVSGPSRRNSAD